MITLASPNVQVVIDPERGGEIRSITRPDGTNVLFHEPWPTPAPAIGSLTYGSDDADWLSRYRGGWQVMFPNAGEACVVDGYHHPVHGEAFVQPFDVVASDANRLALRTTITEGLVLERWVTLHPDRATIHVVERVSNRGNHPRHFLWGHHPALLAVPGTLIDLPPGRTVVDAGFEADEADLEAGAIGTWPTVRGRDGQSVRLDQVPERSVERVVYLPDRPAGWFALRQPESRSGVGLAWDVEAFPHLWLWQQIGGQRFPFHGRARIVALEPVSAWPGDGLDAAITRGQARSLASDRSATAWLTLSLFRATDEPVMGIGQDGVVLPRADPFAGAESVDG